MLEVLGGLAFAAACVTIVVLNQRRGRTWEGSTGWSGGDSSDGDSGD